MKIDKLVDAIGMIDDEYIIEAHDRKKVKLSFSWDLLGKLAAAGLCLLLLVNIFPVLFKSSENGSASSQDYYYEGSSYNAKDSYVYSSEMSVDDEDVSDKRVEDNKDRKLILSAHMNLETQDLDDTNTKLTQLVEKYNGYFQSNSIYSRGSYTRICDANIRIPADNYSMFIEEVKLLGNTISYSETVDDVTAYYMDIEARLNSLKVQEEKVLEFYEKANTIEDLMAVESRLSELRYEIESYEAQIKNYDLLVAYSTLDISISETKQYSPTSPNFFTRLSNAFTNGFSNFIDSIEDVVIDVVYNIWTILLLILIGFIGYRIYKKVRNRRK